MEGALQVQVPPKPGSVPLLVDTDRVREGKNLAHARQDNTASNSFIHSFIHSLIAGPATDVLTSNLHLGSLPPPSPLSLPSSSPLPPSSFWLSSVCIFGLFASALSFSTAPVLSVTAPPHRTRPIGLGSFSERVGHLAALRCAVFILRTFSYSNNLGRDDINIASSTRPSFVSSPPYPAPEFPNTARSTTAASLGSSQGLDSTRLN